MMNHPILETLKYTNNGWVGSVVLKALFEHPIPFRIRGYQHQPPHEADLLSLTWLLEHQHKIRLGLERALFGYYSEAILPTLNKDFTAAALQIVTLLKQPSAIWNLISACEIRIGFERDLPEPDESVFIGFEVPWDEEHGMDVYLTDWCIAVGIEAGHWSDYLSFDLEGNKITDANA
jgi:hypothetical protein